ncbi:predicted protein [Nematostella vectensis]|uniref:G-protein coupled receptors family 1 profile domain-containing protein n=1 Tax=Nematostella vectensis TaxID=45351 RepID=A7RIJ3_NEMVE|nr:predicted protein [Nematostella vectensis]|eukprot:XP_001640879.1 predicted protein [Nematostella vectensis]
MESSGVNLSAANGSETNLSVSNGSEWLTNDCSRSEFFLTINTILYTGIFLVSFFGNTFLILDVIRKSTIIRVTTFELLYMNIAIAGILIAFFALPRELFVNLARTESWHLGGVSGLVLCKLVCFITDIYPLVSALLLCFIVIDRYVETVWPLYWTVHRKRKFHRIAISISWIAPGTFLLYYLSVYKLVDRGTEVYCAIESTAYFDPKKSFQLFGTISGCMFFIAPLVIIILLSRVILQDCARVSPSSNQLVHLEPEHRSSSFSNNPELSQSQLVRPSSNNTQQSEHAQRQQRLVRSTHQVPRQQRLVRSTHQVPRQQRLVRSTHQVPRHDVDYRKTRVGLLMIFIAFFTPFYATISYFLINSTSIMSCTFIFYWRLARMMTYVYSSFSPVIYLLFNTKPSHLRIVTREIILLVPHQILYWASKIRIRRNRVSVTIREGGSDFSSSTDSPESSD